MCVNQAYSRLSTTHGHIKLDSVVYAGVCVIAGWDEARYILLRSLAHLATYAEKGPKQMISSIQVIAMQSSQSLGLFCMPAYLNWQSPDRILYTYIRPWVLRINMFTCRIMLSISIYPGGTTINIP